VSEGFAGRGAGRLAGLQGPVLHDDAQRGVEHACFQADSEAVLGSGDAIEQPPVEEG
jgi:hypothetical protein